MIFEITNLTDNKELFGNKAYNLFLLQKNNFPILKGLVLTTELFDNYNQNKEIKNLEEIIQKVDEVIGKNNKLAVRSSANFEDSQDASFAGIFESYINVSELELKNSIIKVLESVNSNKALEYYKKNKIDKNNVKMAVIIQEMMDPEISGVCFTQNPLNQKEEIVIEYVKGSNQAFVSGEESSQNIIFNKNSLEPLKSDLNDNEKMLEAKLAIFIEIEKMFGKPQDIEWGISKDGEIKIFQARPIISNNVNTYELGKDINILAHGMGLSSGIVSGHLKFIDTNLGFEDLKNSITKENIIFADRLRVDQILAIKNACGAIVMEASLLSHTAIQAREFGIPCVGAIYDKNLFIENQRITIDGAKGLIIEGDIKEKGLLEKYDVEETIQNFPNYYNFELIKSYNAENFEFLYCINKDKAMIYLPKVGDKSMINESTEIINKEFNINKDNILINKVKIYDSEMAPSSVYSYYVDYKKSLNNEDYKKILDQAKIFMEELNIEEFKKLGDETRAKTHDIFKKGFEIFKKFKEDKDTNKLVQAAELFNEALQSTIMFSNVIVFSFGTTYLEKHLKAEGNMSLVEFFASSDYPNKKLVEFSNLLTHYKNSELETLKSEDQTFIDVIDYIYGNGYSEFVIKYQW